MANLLLKDTLDGKIAIEDIINWLTTDEIENSKWDDINKFQCTQCEFLLYFLNFLRDQTKSVRQSSCNARPSPNKAIRSHISSDVVVNEQNGIEKPHRRVSLFNISESQTHEPRSNHVPRIGNIQSSEIDNQNRINVSSKTEISPISSQNSANLKLKTRLTSGDPNVISELEDLLNSHNKTPERRLDNRRNSSDDFNLSYKTNTTSTPINEKNLSNKINKAFNGFNQHDSSPGAAFYSREQVFQISNSHSDVSPSFSRKESSSGSYIRNLKNLNNTNENFDSSNCLLISKNDRVSSRVDSFSKNNQRDINSVDYSSLSESSSNEFRNFNSNSRSGNLSANESHSVNSFMVVNGSCEGAVSPLQFANPATPQNSKLLYSRSVERSQNSKSSPQHNFEANTPKQASQRSSKITPRQNASLADFISIDTRSSRKNSSKKTNNKIQPAKISDGETPFADRLSLTEESFPEIGKNCGRRKRRIKPTKLDVSDGKGNDENSTFGVISRPQIVNPQFLEALPTDKSDTMSFETERDLLRLERQKQQTSSANLPVENNVPNILSKTKNIKKSAALLTPSLEFVENGQALDILAEIYSSLLDYNLVLNPMKELNFVISLITLQYYFENTECQDSVADKCCSVKTGGEFLTIENDESVIDGYNKSKKSVNIEFLNEELGCKVLADDISVLAMDKKVSLPMENDFKLIDDKEFDNLTKSSSTLDDREENDCTNDENRTTNEGHKMILNEEEYFRTIHNCIYFSTKFLNTQRVLLSLLDRATLKLLYENNRIATFLPDLKEYLNKCYRLKSNESNRLKNQINSLSATEANVSFQIDTDNRENFPSLGGFQSFRKQRDLFYEALRIWEVKHLVRGWQFSNALGGRIRSLLSLHNDAANYCHFARLFKSQLLLSCIGNGPQEDTLDDESFGFLKSLKHLDPEKFTRLQERLVTPLSSKGPVPPPSFPGVQEFYKDFILHASNNMFYAHLQDCLVHEIMELNDTQFTGSEIEETETMVDEETKLNFITCISSLRLLAKFLGLLVSLPYKCEQSTQESVLATQLELRSQVLPPINLQYCIHNAIANGKLALTIPWIVKYLAMLDAVSLRLPYYRTVLEMLCYIYCESRHDSRLDNPVSLKVVILLKFTIGWLFELCNFPERLYFNSRISQFHRKLKSMKNFNFNIKNPQNTLAIELDHQRNDLNQSGNSGPCTDSLDIIDERILYVCCPFLVELKTLLIADQTNLNNSTTIRHITPVSSGFEKPFGSTSTKQLQLQLEEAFFHGQPISTRKTVDFVSERVASSCVKHICNFLLPQAREKNLIKFQNIISKHTLPDDFNVFKSFMSSEMNSIALNLSSELKPQFEKDVSDMCESRSKNSIQSLLAEDTLPSVKETCDEIAIRMAKERINHWIRSHITGGALFIKDMEIEVDKIYKNKNLATQFEKRIHNVNAASPTDVIVELRSMIWDLLENKGESLTLEKVLKCLDNLYESLTERADLLPGPEKIIGTLSVDFLLFLAAYRTDIFVPEIHERLIRIWKMECLNFLEKESILSRIFSPRNIMLLAIPGNPDVWLPLGQFINKMLKERVLSIQTLSERCTILLRYDWQPVEILKHISSCLAEGIKDFESTDEESEKMKLLLQWIAETCENMEFTFD